MDEETRELLEQKISGLNPELRENILQNSNGELRRIGNELFIQLDMLRITEFKLSGFDFSYYLPKYDSNIPDQDLPKIDISWSDKHRWYIFDGNNRAQAAHAKRRQYIPIGNIIEPDQKKHKRHNQYLESMGKINMLYTKHRMPEDIVFNDSEFRLQNLP